jgi:hypothetical protein
MAAMAADAESGAGGADPHRGKRSSAAAEVRTPAGRILASDDLARQVRQLRVILDSAEAKEKEREWLRNQVDGELDESRLAEGVAGERAVYRRRGKPDMPFGLHQRLPKRLEFCLDVSSSMARGNQYDKRLDRTAQTAAMIMLALDGYAHKFTYAISGHSGSGPHHEFVQHGAAPRTDAERRAVLDSIFAHARSCVTGDATLEATRRAVARVTEEEADDYIVIVMSDANLGRYGVAPSAFGDALTGDPRVSAFAVFIAERHAAEFLQSNIPAGRAFVVLEPARLPGALSDIFASAALE